MLLEALNFAATYLITPRKRSGEITSSVNLWARSRRVARAWGVHEEACHAEVLKSIAALPRRRAVAVLGSGLLRDTPIKALSAAFETVWLYDLQHLASVRLWARAKSLQNLNFITRDLSGVDAQRSDPSAAPRPLDFLAAMPDLDLVISANLLSQIGVGIGRLVEQDRSLPSDTAARLVKAHLDGMAALPCPALLMTDIAYDVIDKGGKILERDDLLLGAEPPGNRAAWSWTVAPCGELSPDYQAVHRVISAPFNGA